MTVVAATAEVMVVAAAVVAISSEDGGGNDCGDGLQTGSISRSGRKLWIATFLLFCSWHVRKIGDYVLLVITVPGSIVQKHIGCVPRVHTIGTIPLITVS